MRIQGNQNCPECWWATCNRAATTLETCIIHRCIVTTLETRTFPIAAVLWHSSLSQEYLTRSPGQLAGTYTIYTGVLKAKKATRLHGLAALLGY